MEKAYKLEFHSEKQGNLSLNCCGCSKTGPLHSFGPAIKPHYLIHYVLSGEGIFRVGEKQYHLSAGNGFFIEPEELVFYQADEENPWTYVWVGFDGDYAKTYMENMGFSKNHPIFTSNKSEELYQIVKDMMEHNTFGISNDLRRNGQLGIFLSILAESIEVTDKNEGDKANNYVVKAVEFIRSNYCNPIKITDVADYVCVNRSYLYTLFRNYLKMSPQQFLSSYRIAKATELLQSTGYPIESIAISCGYVDPLVFTKAFRQVKGRSPSAYRKEIKSGELRHNKEQLEQIELFINHIGE